ncbi:MAG: SDR family NAD(P)-dependent oxidoreductase [Bacteroidales bacterium]|nr:SDR family NAD(P)-dependent oxidoreductase [Bacteroidales bacterium]
MNNAVIIGASSGLGRALAEQLSTHNFNLLLIARSERDLLAVSRDLKLRYKNEVNIKLLDFSDLSQVDGFIKNLETGLVYKNFFICVGKIIENDTTGIEKSAFKSMVDTNFTAIAYFLNKITNCYTENQKIHISLISSIAVIRPRGNNIIYSTAKAALDFYGRALQHKFHDTGISIQIVRLGYVDTSMAYGKKLLFPVVTPNGAAKKIYKLTKTNRRIIYFPGYWRYIRLILNLIPWRIYKKLVF